MPRKPKEKCVIVYVQLQSPVHSVIRHVGNLVEPSRCCSVVNKQKHAYCVFRADISQRFLHQIEAISCPLLLSRLHVNFSSLLFWSELKLLENDFFFGSNVREKIGRSFKHSAKCSNAFPVAYSS